MTTNRQMIVLAREAAGFTQNSLAHAVGISQAYLSKIEHGFDEAPAILISALARECHVPVGFFSQTEEVLGEGLVDFFHRKRLTLPSKPLRQAQAQVNVTRLEVMRLLRSIDLTDVAPFPALSINESFSPEEASHYVRLAWRIPSGPMPNLVSLLEAAAVPILRMDLGHEKLSAISIPGPNQRHLIVLNSTQSASAQRFSLAHELGHLIMHNGVTSNDLEREADEFAAALLMPRVDIEGQLRHLKFQDLGALKNVWRVSLASLIYRAKKLGHLTDRQSRTYWIKLNQMTGGRRIEPGEFEREEPRLLRKVIEHYQADLGYSEDDLASVIVAEKEVLLRKYLGRDLQTLRAVGRPALHSLSVRPSTD